MKKCFLAFAVLFLFLAAACAQQSAQPGQPVQQKAEVQPAPTKETAEIPQKAEETKKEAGESTKKIEEVAATISNLVEIDMIAKKFEFVPSTITVKQGQKVKLSIKSIDVAHGFGLPDYKIIERLDPGQTVTVEFTADKKGTFTFFCSVSCGSDHGAMKGKLIVE